LWNVDFEALSSTEYNQIGLKIRRPQGRGGSSPPLGTMIIKGPRGKHDHHGSERFELREPPTGAPGGPDVTLAVLSTFEFALL
jgi:hypothetical protein